MSSSAPAPDLAILEAAISGLRNEFIGKLKIYLEDLENIAEDILANGPSPAAFDKAMNIAHKIVGVARTFGFDELGETAQVTEAELLVVLDDASAPNANEIAILKICELAEHISETCDAE